MLLLQREQIQYIFLEDLQNLVALLVLIVALLGLLLYFLLKMEQMDRLEAQAPKEPRDLEEQRDTYTINLQVVLQLLQVVITHGVQELFLVQI